MHILSRGTRQPVKKGMFHSVFKSKISYLFMNCSFSSQFVQYRDVVRAITDFISTSLVSVKNVLCVLYVKLFAVFTFCKKPLYLYTLILNIMHVTM